MIIWEKTLKSGLNVGIEELVFIMMRYSNLRRVSAKAGFLSRGLAGKGLLPSSLKLLLAEFIFFWIHGNLLIQNFK